MKAKESGDCVPPDFVGAVIADDLDGCIKMSEQYRLYQDEKDREKEEKYREEKEAYCLNQNAVAEEKIRGAMASVMAGGRIENEKVTIYKTPDKSKTMTVVSAMMNAAGVDIPIRTKGWIERKLGYIIIRDGECVNLWFLKAKGCKCPERVFDYLNQMAKSIIEKQEGAA